MTVEERTEFLELLKDAHSLLGELDEGLARAAEEMNRAGIIAIKVDAAGTRKVVRHLRDRLSIQLGTQKAIQDGRVSPKPVPRGKP